MGITYREFVWLTEPGRVNKKYIFGGVLGCPKDMRGSCEKSSKEECARCWGREIPGTVIAEITGDINVFGISPLSPQKGMKFFVQKCYIDSGYLLLYYEGGFFAASKEGFRFYMEEEMKKEFTKADLKDGMMVEDNVGRKYLYLGGKLRKSGICKDCDSDEICKIGYPNYESNFTISELLIYGFSKIIWERKEAKEISSEEAFAILKQHYGCDVKIREK